MLLYNVPSLNHTRTLRFDYPLGFHLGGAQCPYVVEGVFLFFKADFGRREQRMSPLTRLAWGRDRPLLLPGYKV